MNDNKWIILILWSIFCFKSTLQQDVSANSCKTTFDIYKDRKFRYSGIPFLQSNIFSSNECITACVNTPTCVGLEIATIANNAIQCYLNSYSLTFQKLNRTDNDTLIILKRCPEGTPPVICGNKFIRTNNSHVFGLTQVGKSSALSAAECLQLCERNSSCRSVDYNRQDKTCFIGFTQNPATSSLNNVDHYDLVVPIEIDCVPVEVEKDCKTSFVYFNNTNSIGCNLIRYVYTSQDCLAACVNMTACVAVEIETLPEYNYSPNRIRCWHHYYSGNLQTVYDTPNVIQIILKRCPEEGVFACNGQFTVVNVNRTSSAGTAIQGVRTLDECQYRCQDAGPACRGVTHDWSLLLCVLHGADTLNKNVTYNYGPTVEWRMDSVCNRVCIPKWKKLMNVAGVGAVQVSLRSYNLTACLEFCVRNRTCIGITYASEPGSPPVCSYYHPDKIAGMKNLRNSPYTVQYEMEDSCNSNCPTEYIHFNNTEINLVSPTIAPVSTAEECVSWCKVDATCKAFIYSISGPFVCRIGKSWVYGHLQFDNNYNSVFVTLGEKCRNPNVIPGNRFTPGPLSTTTTTTLPSSPPVCQTEWTKLPYKNSPGLQQYGSANDYTENECKNVCDLYSKCRIVDYNFNDKTCFLGEDPNHYTGNNNAVNHWIIVKRCPGRCNITVSLYAGINSPGLQQLGTAGQYTELKCKDACAADNTCHSCDYNRSDRTCFLGYQSNPPKGYNFVVNHYEFVRAC